MQEHPFSSERPIETLAEDQLGRKDFATAVAKVINQWRGRDSLVLAIYGPWGSGKSSLKNMILDALVAQNAKTVPLEFNPWEWSGQERVFEGFFGELSSKVGSSDKSKEAAKTAMVMRMYGSMLVSSCPYHRRVASPADRVAFSRRVFRHCSCFYQESTPVVVVGDSGVLVGCRGRRSHLVQFCSREAVCILGSEIRSCP